MNPSIQYVGGASVAPQCELPRVLGNKFRNDSSKLSRKALGSLVRASVLRLITLLLLMFAATGVHAQSARTICGQTVTSSSYIGTFPNWMDGTAVIYGWGTFGGTVSLGQVSSDMYAANSILNEYGAYGSPYQTNSIFNAYGTYGGAYGTNSACNSYATSSTAPQIWWNGQFVAYLTTNSFVPNSVSPVTLVAALLAKQAVLPLPTNTFTACNQSNVPISIAYARFDDASATSTFSSHGWYSINAGACAVISSSLTHFRYFYVYAEGQNLVWQDPTGANQTCIDPVNSFNIVNAASGNCTAQGYQSRPFVQVDTGASTSFTYTFTGTSVTTTTTSTTTTSTAPPTTTTTTTTSTTMAPVPTTTTTTVTTTTTTTLAAPPGQVTLNLAQGWNLVGNGRETNVDVTSAMGDASKITTVWKWIAARATWAFYAPGLTAQALMDYANSKGYEVLANIQAGEGFWVNAKLAATVNLPDATPIASSSFSATGARPLSQGWSLIATGDLPTPGNFNGSLSQTPPSPGSMPINLTSLWAWDTTTPGWYFWAPSLANQGTLGSYLTSKGYLDFSTMPSSQPGTLPTNAGIWVNRP